MLDSSHPIDLAAYSHLHIYPDQERVDRYYVFSEPRLAEADGISLLTYAKGGVKLGGQLTLTTSLALSADEEAAVERMLTAANGAPVRLLFPDWTGGSVTVQVGSDSVLLELTGQPSLLSDNRCALSASLSADQAHAIGKLWKSAKPWLHVSYDVQFTGQDSAEASYHALKNQRIMLHQTEAHTATLRLTNAINPTGGQHTEVCL